MSHYFLFCSCESSSSMEIPKDIYSTKTMVQKNTKSDLSRVFYLTEALIIDKFLSEINF